MCDDLLPALQKRSTCEIVADNLNALHSARQNFIKSESSKKTKDALRHKTKHLLIQYISMEILFTIEGKDLICGEDMQQ